MNLRDYDMRQVYRKWKSHLGPFECFMRSGPFVSLQTYEDFDIDLEIRKEELYYKHQKTLENILGCDFNTQLVIMDKLLSETIEIGYLLNNLAQVKPVLNFNFLFHPYGLVGDKEQIQQLIIYGLQLKDIQPKGYVIMLDYRRYEECDESLYKKKLNNQYEIDKEELPSKDMLEELGYKSIVLFTKETVKEDIQEYLDEMKAYFDIERRHKNE